MNKLPDVGDDVRIKRELKAQGLYYNFNSRHVGEVIAILPEAVPIHGKIAKVRFYQTALEFNLLLKDLEVVPDYDPVMDVLAHIGDEDAFA